MSDTDLRELERQTQRTPDDAGAWLALARAQARVGARDEALAGFYLAAALGGDLVETRAGLRALGAAASPWSHPDGDAGRSRCSPLRGPRRGEIVARAPLRDGASLIVLAEDGTITVAQPGGPLARFEGRTLSPLPTVELGPSRESWWPRAHAFPAAVAGGLVAVHDSHLHFLSRERIVSLELGEPARHLYDPIAVGDRVAILTEDRNRVDPRVSVRTLPNLEESGSFRIGSSWHVLAADSEVITVGEEGRTGERFVRLYDWTGSERGVASFDGLLTDLRLTGERLIGVAARAVEDPVQGVYGWEVSASDRRPAPLWKVRVETRGREPEVATTIDGGCRVLLSGERLRIAADGHVVWRAEGPPSIEPICDREGVLYCVEEGDPSLLRAFDPDGRELFHLSHAVHAFRPCAIDAWSRLIAVFTHDSLQGEIVAIA
ncbi:MAG TPA: hypothetical protein VFF73_10465 [Planctomycetota bacterium]|nr:hypothetical protein [Planctomycetota bacterium]